MASLGWLVMIFKSRYPPFVLKPIKSKTVTMGNLYSLLNFDPLYSAVSVMTLEITANIIMRMWFSLETF